MFPCFPVSHVWQMLKLHLQHLFTHVHTLLAFTCTHSLRLTKHSSSCTSVIATLWPSSFDSARVVKWWVVPIYRLRHTRSRAHRTTHSRSCTWTTSAHLGQMLMFILVIIDFQGGWNFILLRGGSHGSQHRFHNEKIEEVMRMTGVEQSLTKV